MDLKLKLISSLKSIFKKIKMNRLTTYITMFSRPRYSMYTSFRNTGRCYQDYIFPRELSAFESIEKLQSICMEFCDVDCCSSCPAKQSRERNLQKIAKEQQDQEVTGVN